jgi:hypothetical protein
LEYTNPNASQESSSVTVILLSGIEFLSNPPAM